MERVAALKLDNRVFTPEALRVGEEKSPKATNYILIISFLLKMELCHISTSSIITLKWAKLLHGIINAANVTISSFCIFPE